MNVNHRKERRVNVARVRALRWVLAKVSHHPDSEAYLICETGVGAGEWFVIGDQLAEWLATELAGRDDEIAARIDEALS
jgi:hypothetical protein